jgi:hypothetical protein
MGNLQFSISKRHSRPLDFPLGASRLPTRRLATSHSEVRDFPLGRLRLPSGSFANPTGKSHSELSAGEWDFQIAARKASGRTGGAPRSWWGGWRLARRGGPRRLPLGGASGRLATTVRAPLPVGSLPTVRTGRTVRTGWNGRKAVRTAASSNGTPTERASFGPARVAAAARHRCCCSGSPALASRSPVGAPC